MKKIMKERREINAYGVIYTMALMYWNHEAF